MRIIAKNLVQAKEVYLLMKLAYDEYFRGIHFLDSGLCVPFFLQCVKQRPTIAQEANVVALTSFRCQMDIVSFGSLRHDSL